jgi:inorganic pyrophosphatase
MTQKRSHLPLWSLVLVIFLNSACDQNTFTGNYIADFPPVNSDSTINIVVEISAGSNLKYEVTKAEGQLKQDQIDGKPRVIAYLGYPCNYGMIPQTMLPKESGGDGDPLDALLIGGPAKMGAVLNGQLIGVLKLYDSGEQDDKLVAVIPDSPLGHVEELDALDSEFPGIKSILETWFVNYKGPDIMTSAGFGGREEAKDILEKAINDYAGQK